MPSPLTNAERAEFERETERQQARLASLLQFHPDARTCPACGELIFPADTLPCIGVPDCAATMGRDR